MAKPKRQPNYEELRDTWYKKLKDSGFEDIEQDEDTLKRWDSHYFTKRRNLTESGGWQAKAAYYSMAGRFLNEYKFDTPLEQAVWEYHANGLGRRDISKILKAAKLTKLSHASIGIIIYKLKMKMYDMYLEPKKKTREQ